MAMFRGGAGDSLPADRPRPRPRRRNRMLKTDDEDEDDFDEDGRRGTRTPDIFGVNEALYRLSYPPVNSNPKYISTSHGLSTPSGSLRRNVKANLPCKSQRFALRFRAATL